MDIVKILGGIKGKVLDAAHYELLENAYGLQNQNIQQLKANNDAIKENNLLLKSKLEELLSDNKTLHAQIEEYKLKLSSLSKESVNKAISEVGNALLTYCLEDDATEFTTPDIYECITFTRV